MSSVSPDSEYCNSLCRIVAIYKKRLPHHVAGIYERTVADYRERKKDIPVSARGDLKKFFIHCSSYVLLNSDLYYLYRKMFKNENMFLYACRSRT